MKTFFVSIFVAAISLQSALDAAPEPKDSVWSRLVVIGASASAGFGTGSEIAPGAGDVKLAEVADRMIRKKHEAVLDVSSKFFFTDPDATGKKLVDRAKAAEATAVIALDFLFWFGYGKHEDRRAKVKAGMKLLEGLSCPVLIGLLPNMKGAVGRMITADMLPDEKTLADLNKEIEAWAKTQDHVIVVPLAASIDKVRDGKTVKVGSTTWRKGSLPKLLQTDQLHPTVEGLAFMSALAFDALASSDRKISSRSFDLKAPAVARKLIAERKKATKKKAS